MFETRFPSLDYINLNFEGKKFIDLMAEIMQTLMPKEGTDETAYRGRLFFRYSQEITKLILHMADKFSSLSSPRCLFQLFGVLAENAAEGSRTALQLHGGR